MPLERHHQNSAALTAAVQRPWGTCALTWPTVLSQTHQFEDITDFPLQVLTQMAVAQPARTSADGKSTFKVSSLGASERLVDPALGRTWSSVGRNLAESCLQNILQSGADQISHPHALTLAQVLKSLGQGSYGKVYKVQRTNDEQCYALKVRSSMQHKPTGT